MSHPPAPWPTSHIDSVFVFQAPHGAERVIPSTTGAGMEKVELLTSGHVYFDGPEGKILAGPGAVFWHLPGERTIHRYPPGTSYECLCVNFISEARPKRQVARHTRWDDVPSAQAFAREIVDCDTVGQLKDPTFGAYVYYRLFWNAMAHGTRTRHAGPSHLADACAFIRANIAEDLPVEQIAKTTGISGPHLHHLFRLHLVRTPHGSILEERFQKACKLLHGTRLPRARKSPTATDSGTRRNFRAPSGGWQVVRHANIACRSCRFHWPIPRATGIFHPPLPRQNRSVWRHQIPLATTCPPPASSRRHDAARASSSLPQILFFS